MDVLNIGEVKFWTIIIIQIGGFAFVLLKIYAKSYSSEKGKNLATKEDIGEITEKVESIKASLTIKVEELKSDLSYKNEHLIHLRAAERSAIVNYYKTSWSLVLNLTRPDLNKDEIDYFIEKDGKFGQSESKITKDELVRYISEAELILNKTKEDISNLKYLRDIAEAELMFFYDEIELISLIEKLNLLLSEFEKSLFHSINLLLQVFKEINVNDKRLPKAIVVELKVKRSVILANWYTERRDTFTFIRTFNENLKTTLLKRLKGLTS